MALDEIGIPLVARGEVVLLLLLVVLGSFHSIGPLHAGRAIVVRRSARAAASGKSAQSARGRAAP